MTNNTHKNETLNMCVVKELKRKQLFFALKAHKCI